MVRSTEAVSVRFEVFYEREFARAVQTAHLLTGSNDAAEDLVQECFVRLHRRFETLAHPAGYLRVAVVNACKNWQRSRLRAGARSTRSLAGQVVVVPDIAVSSDDADLLAALDRLPFRQRVVVVARYWLDLSEAEIADVLDCRPGTVKSLSARALDALRGELG